MRILITGGGGLLGGRLATLLATDHDLIALIRRKPAPAGVESVAADLLDREAVATLLGRLRPDVVVHCAALADAEACEGEPDRARRENVEATRTLAGLCRDGRARLVAMSTDLVFRGDGGAYREDAAAEPVNEYGRSKLEGEKAALEEDPSCVILRVALLCGRGCGVRQSASETIAHRLNRGEIVTLFEDEWRTPVDCDSVALAVRAVMENPRARGAFHIAGAERLTRYEMGERVAGALGLDGSRLRRARQASHEGAPRSRDVSLDTTRARVELGFKPRPLDLSLRDGRLGETTSSDP